MSENSEFDGLLEQVLREGSRIEPRGGFESRVIAGVFSRAALRKRSMLVALAASCALAAGMALWVNVGAWEGRRNATPDAASLRTVRPVVNRPVDRPPKEERSSKNRKVRLSRAVTRHLTENAREESSRSLSPESSPGEGDILRTLPIAIVPLRIDSIEVAQLKNQRTKEGKPNGNEETSWSVVLVCDSRCIDHRMGAGGRTGSE